MSDGKTSHCHGQRDGDCIWPRCPQLRDNEPIRSGRHCPLDILGQLAEDEEEGTMDQSAAENAAAKRLIALSQWETGAPAQSECAEAQVERLMRELDNARKQPLALLRQSYVTLAFAFHRLHGSSRSRDGELCLDFQKVRAEIEKFFKENGVKL